VKAPFLFNTMTKIQFITILILSTFTVFLGTYTLIVSSDVGFLKDTFFHNVVNQITPISGEDESNDQEEIENLDKIKNLNKNEQLNQEFTNGGEEEIEIIESYEIDKNGIAG
jgi:hypothetical protein